MFQKTEVFSSKGLSNEASCHWRRILIDSFYLFMNEFLFNLSQLLTFLTGFLLLFYFGCVIVSENSCFIHGRRRRNSFRETFLEGSPEKLDEFSLLLSLNIFDPSALSYFLSSFCKSSRNSAGLSLFSSHYSSSSTENQLPQRLQQELHYFL